MCSIFASRTFHIKMQMKADMSEEELSLQCQRGDMRARHTLYERYGGSLMAICLRYIGDRETAGAKIQKNGLQVKLPAKSIVVLEVK